MNFSKIPTGRTGAVANSKGTTPSVSTIPTKKPSTTGLNKSKTGSKTNVEEAKNEAPKTGLFT